MITLPGITDDGEFTALFDPDTPRADMVGSPANGVDDWLVMKGAEGGGLLDPEFVRDLLAKGEDGDMTTARERQPLPNGITLSGSPAQIAAFIHAASVRKAEPEDNRAADGSTEEQVSKDMGPELDGDPGAMDALDVTVPLAEPEAMAPGDPGMPGSPAWESVDAATAMKWTSVLARAGVAIGLLADREMLEAAAGDEGDAENAWCLEDVCCAIDYAISVLAPFAVAEQTEADCGEAMLAAIGKAMATDLTAPLGVIESLAVVRKAGRVLSASNEAAIRAAAESLQKVLASLPEAPIAKEKGAAMPATAAAKAPAPVAKETATPEAQAADTGPVAAGGTTGMGEPRDTGPAEALPGDGPQRARPGDHPGRTVVKSALALVYDRHRSLVGVTDSAAILTRVGKADGEEKKPMQAVFDQDGDLIGIVDPDAIMPVTGAGAKPADDGTDGEMQAGPAAAADGDMTPQPPADAGTPADAVGKAAATDVITVNAGVLESIVAKAVAAAVGALAPAQDVAKQADVAGALAQVETLKARLAVVEETPAAPRVFTNGAVPPRGNGPVPPAHQMRGQDRGGAQPVDVAKARALKETLYRGTAAEQNAAFNEMQEMAVGELAALQRR